MTKAAQAETRQFEQWLNPLTHEVVRLRYNGQQTTVERGGKTAAAQAKPFDEAAARAQVEDAQEFLTRWDVMRVLSWRQQWLSGRFKSLAEAKEGFVAAGFPLKLWDDMNAFARAIGWPTPEDGNTALGAYSSGMTLEGDGTLTVSMGDRKTTIHLPDPEWKNNLLVNPTSEIKARYAALNAVPDNIITPPTPQAQAESALWEQSTQLAKAGFIRMSPRRPDGSLWLSPGLELHRAELLKLERPVVRPYVKAGKPTLWDSKFGGVPYRPKEAAWPIGHSGEPMSFLAQIDLGEANKDGVLPDLPRHGLLQFFAADPSLDYQENKVIYWPHITHDPAALSTQMLTSNSDDLLFNPPEKAMGFVTDSEIPDSTDEQMNFARVPDSESDVGYEQESDNAYLHPEGHRLRGYPLIMNAPIPSNEDWQLLFQLDGDDSGEQLYGGEQMGGWLGFFIRRSDLQQLNFSRVQLEMDAF